MTNIFLIDNNADKMKKVKFVDPTINKSIAELLNRQDHRTLVLWATDCAEHVLHFFEKKKTKDDRPRKAIKAGRAWVCGEITMSEARSAAFEAHAAAREADQGAACAAARAAGQAAATAHVRGHVIHAATYAAKAAAYSAESNNSQANTAKERNWQYQHLLEIGENK